MIARNCSSVNAHPKVPADGCTIDVDQLFIDFSNIKMTITYTMDFPHSSKLLDRRQVITRNDFFQSTRRSLVFA